jgi:DNA polymerase-3 subunit alpha
VATPFTHLHLHTQYSLLDGAIKHNPLFERVRAIGQSAIAMTDHGNLFGAIEFYEKAVANGVKPIIGCEAYIAAGSRFDKEKRERDAGGFDAISHQLLIATNDVGYRNLMVLISKAYLEGFYYKPRVDLELLAKHSEGLITTSGCLSSLVSRRILAGELDAAWQIAEEFKRTFPDRYYLELQRHGIPDQDRVNAELVKMAADLRVPLLATNDAHYLEHADHEHHDALLCIGTAASLDDPSRFRFDGRGFYVKSGDEMLELFHDHPAAVRASMEIAERCSVEIPMGKYHMPEFQVPANTTRERVLAENAHAGLRRRLGLAPDEPLPKKLAQYERRLDYELGVIQQMGFAGYFLIVADFIGYARGHGIPVGPGRGSSAGSLVAYSLGITGVDPIEYDIIFERFLNPERVSMPDIDVDFCMRGRQQVIEYVSKKYDEPERGDDGRRVAQIITFGTLQARAVLRDVGRVMGMPFGDVDRIAKLIPETLGIKIDEALEQSPELRARAEADGQVAKLIETGRRLEGLTRHASTHAAGVVIGDQPLIQLVPLYRDSKTGDVVVQYDMRCVEKIGLIKFDFLGLKTLTVLADAERNVRASGDAKFDVEKIPLGDERTFDLLCRGDTEGVFQMESSGMTDLVTKLKPRSFKEIIPLIALYRPGPLGSGMVEDYVARKHGQAKVEYLVPELQELLAETLGVIVYQDQVLQIANRLAGYSLGEADLLRRAMGKKKPEEMAKHRDKFVAGCAANRIDPKKAATLFDQVAEFAEYGFPKAHSTAYAFVTYQTAYLKANHPREYWAALLSIEAGNHDKLARYIAHARDRKIDVLPPDVNESARDFTPVAEGIRFGLAGVKNVGEGAIESILGVRAERGPFESLFDFASRVDSRRVNRRVVESLVKCGAFDSLHANRASVWNALDAALESGAAAQRDREIGQESLFGDAGGSAGATARELPEAPAWTEAERLANEKEVLGFYVTGHPLEAHAAALRRFTDVTAVAAGGRVGRDVRAGGVITALRETRTRRGQTMGFATLEDATGSFELVIFAEPFGVHRALLKRALESGSQAGGGVLPLIVSGSLESADPPRMLAREIYSLAEAEEKLAARVAIRLLAADSTRDRLQALKAVLGKHGGDCTVTLHVTIPGESETVMALPDTLAVTPTDQLVRDVNALFGRDVAEVAL